MTSLTGERLFLLLTLQNADEKKVEAMLASVCKVVSGLQGEKVVQLGLIKGKFFISQLSRCFLN